MNRDFTLLLVDSDAQDASWICGLLQHTEFSEAPIVRYAHVDEVLITSFGGRPDVVLISIDEPAAEGVADLRKFNSRFQDFTFIVLTKSLDEPLAITVLREGAHGYLSKDDLNSQKLGQTIRFSIERNAHITALKKSYEALRLSEQRFQRLFHNNPSTAMTLTNDEGVLIEVNEVFLNVLELKKEHVIGRKGRDLDIWVNPGQRTAFVQELRQGGLIRNREVKMKSKSGKILDFLFSMDTLETDGGTMLISSAIHISARLIAERKLRESERNLDTLINSSSDAIWLIDKEMRLIKANDRFRNTVAGHGLEYKYGDTLIPPSLPKNVAERWQRLYDRVLAGESFTEESRDMLPDGEVVYFEVAMSPVFDDFQQVIGAGCFKRDITRQKQTELKIESVKERYEKLSKATNDAVWDLDMRTNAITWNHGLETIFGYGKTEKIPDHQWHVDNIHPDDYQKVMDRVKECIVDHKTNWSATYRYRCANGDYKFVYDRGVRHVFGRHSGAYDGLVAGY